MPAAGAMSAVVTPEFFLSPEGMNDARAELEATLAGVRAPATGGLRGDRHAQCRFPARTAFLVARLGLTDLPKPRCTAFEAWRAATGAATRGEVSVIFAGYATDDAVGRLGHLFLRIGAEPGKVRPLDLTVNYAINFPKDAGTLGKIAGSFAERFDSSVRLRPLYVYLDSYGNKDLRDIWHYTLALSDDERRMLIAHLWEIRKDARLTYALLSHNCVTFLLSLVEVARPALDLQGEAVRLLAPSDAIKVLRASRGLVTRTDYTPSGGRVFLEQYAALTRKEKAAFERVLTSGETTAADTAAVDEALGTYLLLSIRKAANEGNGAEVARLRKIRLKVLGASKPPPAATVGAPRPGPEAGHSVRRIAVSGGRAGGASYGLLAHRLVMHGRLDAPDGFTPDDHFEGLDLSLRLLAAERRLLLDELLLLNVESLPSIAAYDAPLARQLRIGVLGNYLNPHQEAYAFYVRQGIGAAYFEPRFAAVLAHVTAGYVALAARRSEIRPYGEVGAIVKLGRRAAADFGAEYRPRVVRGYEPDGSAWAELRGYLTRDWNLGLRGEYAVARREWDVRATLFAFY